MRAVSETLIQENGEWWYEDARQRHRAKIGTCETCGEQFADFPSGKAKYCSDECRRRLCKRCGDPFKPATNRSTYCSLACKRGSGICENCGKSYVYSHHGAKRFCSKECFYDQTCPVGTIIDDPSGYTLVKTPPGTPGVKLKSKGRAHWMWTHRYVMQQKLGRTLLKTEQPHHINGNRKDNRPENLELWKGSHPAGVRAKDYHCAGCRCPELNSSKRGDAIALVNSIMREFDELGMNFKCEDAM
jgi:hypothetical protein